MHWHLLRSLDIYMYRMYVDNESVDECCGSLIELTLRLHGATVVNALSDNVSHVIVDSR